MGKVPARRDAPPPGAEGAAARQRGVRPRRQGERAANRRARAAAVGGVRATGGSGERPCDRRPRGGRGRVAPVPPVPSAARSAALGRAGPSPRERVARVRHPPAPGAGGARPEPPRPWRRRRRGRGGEEQPGGMITPTGVTGFHKRDPGGVIAARSAARAVPGTASDRGRAPPGPWRSE